MQFSNIECWTKQDKARQHNPEQNKAKRDQATHDMAWKVLDTFAANEWLFSAIV